MNARHHSDAIAADIPARSEPVENEPAPAKQALKDWLEAMYARQGKPVRVQV